MLSLQQCVRLRCQIGCDARSLTDSNAAEQPGNHGKLGSTEQRVFLQTTKRKEQERALHWEDKGLHSVGTATKEALAKKKLHGNLQEESSF